MSEELMNNENIEELKDFDDIEFDNLIDEQIDNTEKKFDIKSAAIGAGAVGVGFGIGFGIKGIMELKRLKAKQKALKEIGIDMSIKAIKQEEAQLIKEIKVSYKGN